jgi:hypothetical protein
MAGVERIALGDLALMPREIVPIVHTERDLDVAEHLLKENGQVLNTVWEAENPHGSDKNLHPTAKPTILFEKAMQVHSNPGELCYEPFAGSGSQFAAGELQGRMRVEVEFVRKARAMECKAVIALGTFSVGNPQFALGAPEYADTVRLIRQYYTPLWDAGEIGLDYHAYAPSMAHIYGEDLVWHERRWLFYFTVCGFAPDKGQGVFFGECGVDEDGVGGLPAHKATTEDVTKHIARLVEIQSRPVVVDGREYPSPVRGGAIFCYGNNGDPSWANGYDIRRFGAAPFVKAGVWVGARGLRKALKPKG